MYIYEKLSGSDLFRGLNTATIRQILEEISYHRNTYQKNDIIAFDGDEVMGQYIMLQGSIRGEMTSCSGKIIKIEDVEGCHLLAPAFLFGNDNHYPVDIIANKETDCIFISKLSFRLMLQMNEDVQKNYLDLVSGRAQFLSNKIKFLAFQTIKGKIAHYLVKRSKGSTNNTVDLPYSQDNLADLFGVTRPALTRALRELDQEKIICAQGKRVCILDKKRLMEFVQ